MVLEIAAPGEPPRAAGILLIDSEAMVAAIPVDDPGKMADTIGATLQLTIEEKQGLLEMFDPVEGQHASPRNSRC